MVAVYRLSIVRIVEYYCFWRGHFACSLVCLSFVTFGSDHIRIKLNQIVSRPDQTRLFNELSSCQLNCSCEHCPLPLCRKCTISRSFPLMSFSRLVLFLQTFSPPLSLPLFSPNLFFLPILFTLFISQPQPQPQPHQSTLSTASNAPTHFPLHSVNPSTPPSQSYLTTSTIFFACAQHSDSVERASDSQRS